MKSLFSKLFLDREREHMGFSLGALRDANPALAAQFTWTENHLPEPLPSRWLHWGCGPNAFEDFLNVDFQPQAKGVVEWDFLDLWPAHAAGQFEGAFSEDTLEHFFLAEQAYILCNLNLMLRPSGVSRILMPSWSRLMALGEKAAAPGEFLRETFGVATEVDAMNAGLRFSGHRWLHDEKSLAFLASDCGFEAVPTTCAESTVERLSNRNLRSEDNSASFATDLVKHALLTRIEVPPADVHGAEQIEALDNGIGVWRATASDAQVSYQLEKPIAAGLLALANIRSANASEFRSHYYKSILLHQGSTSGTWRLDETLKSRPCMNVLTRQQLRQTVGERKAIDAVSFVPVAMAGQVFTLGALELFVEGGA